MSFTDYLEGALLKHFLKIASMSVPTNLYVGLHIASTLASSASSGASSISVTHQISQGAKIVLNPNGVTEETVYAGTVSGSGPYTVNLVTSGGAGTTLASSHSSGEKVKYDPKDDGTLIREPSAGSYARVQANAWNNPADDGAGKSQCTNNGDVSFAQATGSAWGLVTHFAIYDASTGGNVLAIGELDDELDVVLNATLVFPSTNLKVKLD